MPPVSQRRAEAVLARFFTDTELAGINLGPVRRPTTQRSWMTNLEAAGFLAPPTPPAVPVQAPVATPAPVAAPTTAFVPPSAVVPKPLPRQLVSAVAAAPAPPLVTPAPAAALPAATASKAIIPPPFRKPDQKNAVKAPAVLSVSHTLVPRTPIPLAKPKR
jgi:hypothetical protein